MDVLKVLETLAENVKEKMNLKYNEEAILYLEGFIDRMKDKIPEGEKAGLINALGAFIGQCAVEMYGGYWADSEDYDSPAVLFNEENGIFPITWVQKQFNSEPGDTITQKFKFAVEKFNLKTPDKK